MATTWHTKHNAAGGGGGSFASPYTLQEAADNALAGDTVKVHNTGTYTAATQIDFDTWAGTYIAPIQFIGVGPLENDGPAEVTINYTNNAYCFAITKSWLYFENLKLVDTVGNGTRGWDFSSGDCNAAVKCKAKGFYDGFYLRNNAESIRLVRCEAYNSDNVGFTVLDTTNYGAVLIGCVAHGNLVQGFYLAHGATCIWCLAFNNGSVNAWDRGFSGTVDAPAVGGVYMNCVADDNRNEGIRITGNASCLPVVGNTIGTNNGRYGVEMTAAGTVVLMFGCLFPSGGVDGNALGATSNATALGTPDTVLKANLTANEVADFIDNIGVGRDYRLGASSAARGAGWPGQMDLDT